MYRDVVYYIITSYKYTLYSLKEIMHRTGNYHAQSEKSLVIANKMHNSILSEINFV